MITFVSQFSFVSSPIPEISKNIFAANHFTVKRMRRTKQTPSSSWSLQLPTGGDWKSYEGQIHGARKYHGGCQGPEGAENGKLLFHGYTVLVCAYEKVLESRRGDGCATTGIHDVPTTVHLKTGKTVNSVVRIFYHNKKNYKGGGQQSIFSSSQLLSKSCLPWGSPGTRGRWGVRVWEGKLGLARHQNGDMERRGVSDTCLRNWFRKMMISLRGQVCEGSYRNFPQKQTDIPFEVWPT